MDRFWGGQDLGQEDKRRCGWTWTVWRVHRCKWESVCLLLAGLQSDDRSKGIDGSLGCCIVQMGDWKKTMEHTSGQWCILSSPDTPDGQTKINSLSVGHWLSKDMFCAGPRAKERLRHLWMNKDVERSTKDAICHEKKRKTGCRADMLHRSCWALKQCGGWDDRLRRAKCGSKVSRAIWLWMVWGLV